MCVCKRDSAIVCKYKHSFISVVYTHCTLYTIVYLSNVQSVQCTLYTSYSVYEVAFTTTNYQAIPSIIDSLYTIVYSIESLALVIMPLDNRYTIDNDIGGGRRGGSSKGNARMEMMQ